MATRGYNIEEQCSLCGLCQDVRSKESYWRESLSREGLLEMGVREKVVESYFG
jgi:hypothetical protein